MRNLRKTGLAVLLALSAAGPPWSAAETAFAVPAGTIIPIELSKALDARKVKVGDAIESRLPADVLLHGKIVIPRETRILGHITDVKAPTKDSPGAQVGFVFESIVVKKGDPVPIQVTVQAVGRPLQLVDTPTLQGGAGGVAPAGTPRSSPASASPSRSQERVAAIPLDTLDSDEPPPTTMAPLSPTSKGIVGIKALTLEAAGDSSVISSATGNVRLDSGAQMILRTR